MARGNIRFTPGLLTQLGSFGQGPANQQGAAGASMLPPAQQFGPSGLGGMFARNLGGLLGMDMRTPQEKEQQLIEQQRQRLSQLDPNDPTAMSELIKAYAVTDPARAIQLAAAERQRLAAESKTQEEKALKGKQEEGRSLIFDVLMTADDVTTPDVRRTVADLAQGYQVPASVITSLYGAADKGRKDKEEAKKGKYTEGSSYQTVDENGDIWNVQLMNPKEEGQNVKRIYTQIAGNELDEEGNVKTRPEGETALASTVGETPQERRDAELKEDIRKQREGLWVEEQAEARRAIEGSSEALALTDQMINLLTVGVESTGGIANKAKSYLAQTFGFTTEELTNKALIVNIAGNQVLSKIRLLGANPTEGERDFLLQLGADIKNDPKEVTQAKLALARKVLSNSLARQRAKLNMTREQYEEAIQEGGALDFGFVNPYSTEEGGIPSFEEHFGLQKEKQRRKNVNPRGR
jgi:hypothetical protein